MMRKSWWAILLAVGLAAGLLAGTAAAQDKQQKPPREKKDSKTKVEPADASGLGIVPQGNDNEVIDYRISEMIAGWQLGDTDLLHSVVADDVSVVSGAYEPPILGWPSFLATYQKLRARMGMAHKERFNTYTVVRGTLAWSSFQWEFNGQVDGNAARWRGQTTLVLEKRNGKWMIVHDHTSVVQDASAPAPPAAPKP